VTKTKQQSSRVRVKNSASARDRLPVVYPFTAIVGQDEMKLALVLCSVDLTIGGVVIMGHRGTGKSTAVRGLADLLPQITKVKGCFYGCDPAQPDDLCADCSERLTEDGRLPRQKARVPVVDLPLGATEDRVCGTLDIERALVEGIKSFEPGLLARANRGFLYIDEVNLLEDHLIDVLLDSAASGRNVVEREGISVSHPARFVLVGSGNPEEGELRPQLLDRFGLFTQIETIVDLDQRVEIVERRQRFEADPKRFGGEFEIEQRALRQQIEAARKLLPKVEISRELIMKIASVCLKLQVDGHRGELTIARSAKALAALENRRAAVEADVARVAAMSLRHRLRRGHMDRVDSGVRMEQALEQVFRKDGTGRLAAIK
jgi:magnesium chelatase subunit I